MPVNISYKHLLSLALAFLCFGGPCAGQQNAAQPAAFVSEKCTADGSNGRACVLKERVTLLRGPPVTLPRRFKLLGDSSLVPDGGESRNRTDSSCAYGPGNGGLMPATNNDTARSGAAVNLELSSLSAVFVVPSNGSVALRGLTITGALLPNSPFPLPSTSFLALLAFKLPPKASAAPDAPALLELTDLLLATPSCAALSLHQHVACSASPSPNFTVTPTSLVIHRYSTPTTSITNVTLICTGAPAPFPCLAGSASSGAGMLQAVMAMQQDATAAVIAFGAPAPAAQLFLCRDVTLAGMGLADAVSFDEAGFQLVIAGDADGATVLDLTDTTDLISIGVQASVQLHNLTIRGPPLGPTMQLPWSFARVFLWTFSFQRQSWGAAVTSLLVRNCRIELPADELALWWAPMLGRDSVPAALRGSFCVYGEEELVQWGTQVAPLPSEVAAVRGGIRTFGDLEVLDNVTLVTVSSNGCCGADLGPAPCSPGDGAATGPPRCGLCSLQPEGPAAMPPVVWAHIADAKNFFFPGLMSEPWVSGMSTWALVSDTRLALANTSSLRASDFHPAHLAAPILLFGSYSQPLTLDLADMAGAIIMRRANASVTLRALVLSNLPAAGLFPKPPSDLPPAARLRLPPGPPLSPPFPTAPPQALLRRSTAAKGTTEPAAAGQHSAPAAGSAYGGALIANATQDKESLHRSRSLQQYGAGADGADPTQGLSSAMTNFTSCVWTLDFDRPAAVATAAAAGGTPVGDAAAATGSTAAGERLADLPYAFLDSVVLLVPQGEVDWLAAAWAVDTAATGAAVGDPGLVEQLAAMRTGSRLAQTSAAVLDVTRGAGGGGGVASLTFDVFTWCGLRGRNVTLTSQPPGENLTAPGPKPLELPPLRPPAAPPLLQAAAPMPPAVLPPPQRAVEQSPAATPAPAFSVPKPGPQVSPLPALSSGNPLSPPHLLRPPTTAAAPPPVQGAEQQFGGTAGTASQPGSPRRATPVSSLAIGGVVAGVAAASTLFAAAAVLYVRRRHRRLGESWDAAPAGAKGAPGGAPAASCDGDLSSRSCADVVCQAAGAYTGCSGGKDASRSGSLPASLGSGGGGASPMDSATLPLPCCTRAGTGGLSLRTGVSIIPASSPREGADDKSSPPAATATSLRVSVFPRSAPPRKSEERASVSTPRRAAPAAALVQRAVSKMLRDLYDEQRQVVAAAAAACTAAAAGGGGAASTGPNSGAADSQRGSSAGTCGDSRLLESSAGVAGVARTSLYGVAAGMDTYTSLAPATSVAQGTPGTASVSGGSTRGTLGSALSTKTSGTLLPRVVSGLADMDPAVDTLSITGELGRGAQGVVYRGVWRGLPVAVKSLLLQRQARQVPSGAAGRKGGSRFRQAIMEAAISASVSHPNVVATFTYMLQQLDAGGGGDGPSPAGAGNGGAGTAGGGGVAGCATLGAAPGAAAAPLGAGPSGESEVWKLTLVQELCDAGSLRDCLERGRLAACKAEHVPKPGTLAWSPVALPPPTGVGSGTASGARPLWSPSMFLIGNPAPSAPSAPRPEADNGAAAAAPLRAPPPPPPQPALPAELESPAPHHPYVAVMLLVAAQVSRGLAHLHSRSIVHADVSSANILLTSTPDSAAGGGTGGGGGRRVLSRVGSGTSRAGGGGGGSKDDAGESITDSYRYGYVAKLCDFGLSGRLEAADDETHLSGPARRSSAYSAPELVRHGRASPAGDVYALAVVLWELALGLPLPAALARPEGERLRSWLAAQAVADPGCTEALPPGLLSWPDHTPPGYVALVAECLRPSPAERPSAERVCSCIEGLFKEAMGRGAAAGASGDAKTPFGRGCERAGWWRR